MTLPGCKAAGPSRCFSPGTDGSSAWVGLYTASAGAATSSQLRRWCRHVSVGVQTCWLHRTVEVPLKAQTGCILLNTSPGRLLVRWSSLLSGKYSPRDGLNSQGAILALPTSLARRAHPSAAGAPLALAGRRRLQLTPLPLPLSCEPTSSLCCPFPCPPCPTRSPARLAAARGSRTPRRSC